LTNAHEGASPAYRAEQYNVAAAVHALPGTTGFSVTSSDISFLRCCRRESGSIGDLDAEKLQRFIVVPDDA